MRCLTVDDEPIALEGISDYVQRTPFLELAAQCKNAFEAIEVLRNDNIDLIFLDVNMPELNGLDMINSLENPPLIIFTTAYAEYALKGYEVNAIDYLLKPIGYDKFLRACQKAYDTHTLQNNASLTEEHVQFMYIKVDKRLVRVNFNEIRFIEGLKDYVKIHTTRETYITYLSLNKLMFSLPTREFVQVHKSFIVSVDSIEAIDHDLIEIGKQVIPIGRTFKQELFDKVIDKNLLKK